MATFTFTAQGTDTATTNIALAATDKLGFYGANFGDAITVNQYQSSTHAESSTGTHLCTTHINNTKYLTGTTISINGGASATLSSTVPATTQCPLKINFSDAASVATSSATFWVDDGTTNTAGPVGVTAQAAEKWNTSWVNTAGSGTAVALANQAAATSHDFFILLSLSPTSVGTKTAVRAQISLTYQ